MPLHADAECEATDHHRTPERRADDVLDHVRGAAGRQALAHRRKEIGMRLLCAGPAHNGRRTPALARRTRPDEVEPAERVGERVRLDEHAAPVARLRVDVHAGHVEAGALQADADTPGAAEEVESLHGRLANLPPAPRMESGGILLTSSKSRRRSCFRWSPLAFRKLSRSSSFSTAPLYIRRRVQTGQKTRRR